MKLKTHNRSFIFDIPIQVDLKSRMKKVLAPLFDILYRFILWCNRPPKAKEPKPYKLVACAIFKDEACFFQEWIEHNHLVGVEHFFLYNNFSSDHYQEVLQPYIDQQLVTLIDWPVDKGQFPAYEHFWVHYRQTAQWVTFIDLDEFYCPFYDLTVSDWLDKFSHQPSVLVYWKMFGTSGKMLHNYDQLVTEQYTVCWDKLDRVGKVIVNTDWEFTKMYHHLIGAKCSFLGRTVAVPSVDEFGHYYMWPDVDRCIPSWKECTIQLNHYWSKAYDSYRIGKIERGDVNNHARDYALFFVHEKNNIAVDYSIFRFMIQLKLAIGFDKNINGSNGGE